MDELAVLDALAGIGAEPAAPARAGEDLLLVEAAAGEEDSELKASWRLLPPRLRRVADSALQKIRPKPAWFWTPGDGRR